MYQNVVDISIIEKMYLCILAHDGQVILGWVQLELFHFGLQPTLCTMRTVPRWQQKFAINIDIKIIHEFHQEYCAG